MDMKLNRLQDRSDGIFGQLLDDSGNVVAQTLEHAFINPDGSYSPKVPLGTYTCQRGSHQLESMSKPFITFQIMDVPNHTNILFHMGNWNKDSDGCILLGEAIAQSGQGQMITNSVATWKEFMQLQDGLDTFQLIVQ